MAKKHPANRDRRSEPVDLAGAEYTTFTLEAAEDDRILKSSLWLAVSVHAVLLMIHLPALGDRVEADEPPERTVYVVPNVRFEKPPPPPTPIPERRVRRMPAPDPTPDAPEPIRLDEPRLEADLPAVDVDLPIPDAPPLPDPVGPIQVGGEVVKPEKLHVVQPRYTEAARTARIQGVVIVQAIIDRRGDVTDVTVLKGLPLGLTEEAVKAVRQWKFKPATLRGKPVDVYFNLTVKFQLQ